MGKHWSQKEKYVNLPDSCPCHPFTSKQPFLILMLIQLRRKYIHVCYPRTREKLCAGTAKIKKKQSHAGSAQLCNVQNCMCKPSKKKKRSDINHLSSWSCLVKILEWNS